MLNSYKVVMYMQMQYRAKSTREPINNGMLYNQFRPDIVTSIRKLERINTEHQRYYSFFCLFACLFRFNGISTFVGY